MELVDTLEDSEFAMNRRSILYCSKGDLKVHEAFDEKPTPYMMMMDEQDAANDKVSITIMTKLMEKHKWIMIYRFHHPK